MSRLADLSMECHSVSKDKEADVRPLEAEVDKAAAKLWGITDDELKGIQEALAETSKSKRAEQEDEED